MRVDQPPEAMGYGDDGLRKLDEVTEDIEHHCHKRAKPGFADGDVETQAELLAIESNQNSK
jgi:hypothetical protein